MMEINDTYHRPLFKIMLIYRNSARRLPWTNLFGGLRSLRALSGDGLNCTTFLFLICAESLIIELLTFELFSTWGHLILELLLTCYLRIFESVKSSPESNRIFKRSNRESQSIPMSYNAVMDSYHPWGNISKLQSVQGWTGWIVLHGGRYWKPHQNYVTYCSGYAILQ